MVSMLKSELQYRLNNLYFIDGDTVLDVVKSDLPALLGTIRRMQDDITAGIVLL